MRRLQQWGPGWKSWWTHPGGKDTGWVLRTLAQPAQDAMLTVVLFVNSQSRSLELPVVGTDQPRGKNVTSETVGIEGMIHVSGGG